MKYHPHPGHRLTSLTAVLLGFACLGGILYVDKLYFQGSFLREGLPEFSYGWLLRSAIIFLSLVIIAFGITRGPHHRDLLLKKPGSSFERVSVLGTLFASSLFLLVFLFQPAVFSAASQENHSIEWISVLLLLCSSATFTLSAVKVWTHPRVAMVTKAAMALLALIFFVIAMEEISWGQQIFDWDTPRAIKVGNAQHETNLHNYATNEVENLYYFGAFLFLVVLPFLGAWFPTVACDKRIGQLIPRPFVALIGAVAYAYNFDMWNILFIQVSFFGSLIVLSLLAMLSSNDNKERIIVVCTVLLLVITQVIFLNNGDRFVRAWEVTEYKEFFIPLAFLAYSVSVYGKITSSAPLSD